MSQTDIHPAALRRLAILRRDYHRSGSPSDQVRLGDRYRDGVVMVALQTERTYEDVEQRVVAEHEGLRTYDD